MGSLNEDGTFITQGAESLRQLGNAYTRSADRVEIETVVSQGRIIVPASGDPGLAALRIYEGVKLTRAENDSKVQFIAVSGLID